MKKLLLTVMILTLVSMQAYANWGGSAGDGSFGSGHLEIQGSDQVEVVSEDLNIELYRDHAKVVVRYVFHNTGDRIVVRAGFPSIVFSEENEIDNYQIEAGDKKITYEQVKGDFTRLVRVPKNIELMADFDESGGTLKVNWLVSNIEFKKDEKKNVKISYSSKYQMSSGGVSDDIDFDPEVFRYILSTGAPWKGPIKKGKITIFAKSVDADTLTVQPAGKFRRKGNSFVWEFTDLEPTPDDDIVVDLNNAVSVKMNYDPDDSFGSSFYSFEGDRYYYAFHSFMVKASSTLDSADEYKAGNLKDMDVKTAWVEGVKGDGVGEYIQITLKKPQKVSQIGIIPGYAKSEKLYFLNNRAARVTVIINDDYRKTVSLPDEYARYEPHHPKAYRFIDLSGYKDDVKTIQISLDRVYKGKAYNDTCISEIILRRQLASKPAHAGAR